jgi:hypothetical protein
VQPYCNRLITVPQPFYNLGGGAPKQTSSKRKDFTFVDWDINQHGVRTEARSHLMRDRMRQKRELKAKWLASSKSVLTVAVALRPQEGGRGLRIVVVAFVAAPRGRCAA